MQVGRGRKEMIMGKRLALPLLIIATAALGCSWLNDRPASDNANAPVNTTSSATATTTRENPTADIEAMADKFLSEKTFRAKMLGIGEKDKEVKTDMEFVAPDRFRIRTGPGLETIVIGKDMYVSMQPGKFMKLPGTLPSSIPNLRETFNKEGRQWFSDVRYVGEEAVDGKPAYVYEYKNKGPDKLGENDSKIWVAKDNGLPLRIESKFKSGNFKSMTIEYEYDPNIKIEVPNTK